MCGIVAARTIGPAAPHLVEALARLEYRGYDSAGLAVAESAHRVARLRTVRRVGELARRLPEWEAGKQALVGIGHTRWATHGGVAVHNAHPHTDCTSRVAVVHNGILHNADVLRDELESAGHVFGSEVDSEVLAHLVESALTEGAGLREAVEAAVSRLDGSWGLVVMEAATGQIVATTHRSPLIVAQSAVGQFAASDVAAIAPWVDEFTVLPDGDVVELGAGVRWFRGGTVVAAPAAVPNTVARADLTIGCHPDFMSKEIAEQPSAVARVIHRVGTEAPDGELWRSLGLPTPARIAVLGCGTSLNAGRLIGATLGRLGGMAHQAIIASEAAQTVLEPDTLVLALSQSGETADVLSALDIIQATSTPVLALTNNRHSALARRADALIDCHAGPEIGVAATKTFMSQVFAGVCTGLSMLVATGRLGGTEAARLTHDLDRVPDLLDQAIVASSETIPALAEELSSAGGFVFIGRGNGATCADEGALKLKELTYRWAESLPAGELKHGPLALIESGTPVVVIDTGETSLAANIAEVAARGARIVRIGGPGSSVPALGTSGAAIATLPWCGPVESVIALQFLARELAVRLGRDVDRPRNLAKSVTVD